MTLAVGNSTIGYYRADVVMVGTKARLCPEQQDGTPVSIARKIVAAYNRGDDYVTAAGDAHAIIVQRSPGRPVSTGSDATKPIRFRVGTAERKDLEARVKRQGTTLSEYARRKTLAPD